jgi:steroid delta-isomerase-like uncharacterized protein
MTTRRTVLALGALSATALLASPAARAAECPPGGAEAVGAALADKYAAAINARDTSTFAEMHAENYIQNSGRSASGLAAQIELFKRIFAAMPDLRMKVEDRIVAGDRVVTRNSWSATHSTPIRGIAPTGKPFTFHTIDIWRVENGKFAEHWDVTDTVEVLTKLRGG